MKLDSLLIQLQSWAQEELSAQQRLATVLEQLLDAVRSGGAEDLLPAGLALEEELQTKAGRDVRRHDLMERLARTWSVSASSLSLASVIERCQSAGVAVGGLTTLRVELREAVQAVGKQARLLAVLGAHHRGVLRDILGILGESSNDAEARRAGVLVDAEG